MAHKLYYTIQKKNIQNLILKLTKQSNQLLKKINNTNEDYQILLKELKNYKKPKFLLYGNNSLLNILKSPKKSKKLLFKNTYGLLANILYKYKDNLDNDLYEYIKLKDKIRILKYIQNDEIRYILSILNKDEIDKDILTAIIGTNQSILKVIKLEKENNDLKQILKNRYDIYFPNENNYYNLEIIKEFYQNIIDNPNIIPLEITNQYTNKNQSFIEPILYNIITAIMNLPEETYQLLLEYSLIAPLFKYLKNNPNWQDDLDLMLKLCKEDIHCYDFASKNIKSNKEFILTVIDFINKRKPLNEDDIIEKIDKELLTDLDFNKQLIDKLSFNPENIYTFKKRTVNEKLKYLSILKNNNIINLDKDLIIKLIYKTPRTFKYIDKSLIDLDLVNDLLTNFKYQDSNLYYQNFYNDQRFNRHCQKYKTTFKIEHPIFKNDIKNETTDILETISKYLPIEKRPNTNIYIAKCPFHYDNNPSLKIYPERNFFICYSCLTSGDAKKFKKLYNRVEENEYHQYGGLGNFKKNRFYYYLYANLPQELKYNIELNKKFLTIDGCILKLVPKELKCNESLVETAMNQDLSSFRYIINNETYKKKYLEMYPILNYYLPKEEKSKEYLELIQEHNSRRKLPNRNNSKKFEYLDDFFGEDFFDENDELPF